MKSTIGPETHTGLSDEQIGTIQSLGDSLILEDLPDFLKTESDPWQVNGFWYQHTPKVSAGDVRSERFLRKENDQHL